MLETSDTQPYLSTSFDREYKPGSHVYKFPLSELVARVVASGDDTFDVLAKVIAREHDEELQTTFNERLDEFMRGEITNAELYEGVVKDWEKALGDEAMSQFTNPLRALVEAVLNAQDSHVRRFPEKGSRWDKHSPVEISVNSGEFSVTDKGEGMPLDTILRKLLPPKISGNMDHQGKVIGRFGVGFYSLLGLLQGPRDNLIVRTYDGNQGYEVRIGRYSGDESGQTGRFTVIVKPLKQKMEQGTQLIVRSSLIDKTETQDYLRSMFEFTDKVPVVLNTEQIVPPELVGSDSVQTVYDKEKEWDERDTYRLMLSDEYGDSGTLELLVGGVPVETIQTKGTGICTRIVIDMPRDTSMPKSRDKIVFDESAMAVLADAMSSINSVSKDVHQKIAAINTLASVADAIQARSKSLKRDHKLWNQLSHGLASIYRSLDEPKPYFIGYGHNVAAFLDAIKSQDTFTAYAVHPQMMTYVERDIVLPAGMVDTEKKVGGKRLLQFGLPEGISYVVTPTVLIVSDRFDLESPFDVARLNVMLEIHGKSQFEDANYHEGTIKLATTDETERTVVSTGGNSFGQVDGYNFPPLETELQEDVKEKYLDLVRRAELGVLYMPDTFEWRELRDHHKQNLEQYRVKTVEQMELEIVREMLVEVDVARMIHPEVVTRSYSRGKDFLPQYDNFEFWQDVLSDSSLLELKDILLLPAFEIFDVLVSLLPESIVAAIDFTKIDEKKSLLTTDFSEQRIITTFQSCGSELLQQVAELVAERDLSVMPGEERNQLYKAVFFLSAFSESGYSFTIEPLRQPAFLEAATDSDFQEIVTVDRVGQYNSLYSLIRSHSIFRWHDPEDTKIQKMAWIKKNHQAYITATDRASVSHSQLVVDPGSRWQQSVAFRNIKIGSWMSNDTLEHVLFSNGVDTPEGIQRVVGDLERFFAVLQDPEFDQLFPFFITRRENREVNAPLPMTMIIRGELNEVRLREVFRLCLQLREKYVTSRSLQEIVLTAFDLYYENFDLPDRDRIVELWIARIDYGHEYRSMSLEQTRDMINPYSEREVINLLEEHGMGLVDLMSVPFIELLGDLDHEFISGYYKIVVQLFRLALADKTGDEPRILWQRVQTRALIVIQQLLETFADEPSRALKELGSLVSKNHDEELIDRWNRVLESDFDFYDTIRPLIVYLLGGAEDREQLEKSNFFEDAEVRSLKASDLVISYLSRGSRPSAEAAQTLAKIAQRRIEHAVSYQDVEPYGWMRELAQNVFTVTRQANVEKVMSVTDGVYIDGTYEIVVADQAGMTRDQVFMNLLVPQRSAWAEQIGIDADEAWGEFGHGFFTIFREADEVLLQTSTGDGNITLLRMVPVREDGIVKDIEIEVAEQQGDFKGTQIRWRKKTPSFEAEALRARTKMGEHTEMIPAERLEVRWNGETTNGDPKLIAEEPSPVGPIALIATTGRSKVSQNGLYIKRLPLAFRSFMPDLAWELLESHAYSFDFAPSVKLTDSRSDFIGAARVHELAAEAIGRLAVRAYAHALYEGILDYSKLPYDFFTEGAKHATSTSERVQADAQKIANGESIDLEYYRTNEEAFLQLILSAPLIRVSPKLAEVLRRADTTVTQQDEETAAPEDTQAKGFARVLSPNYWMGILSGRKKQQPVPESTGEVVSEPLLSQRETFSFYEIVAAVTEDSSLYGEIPDELLKIVYQQMRNKVMSLEATGSKKVTMDIEQEQESVKAVEDVQETMPLFDRETIFANEGLRMYAAFLRFCELVLSVVNAQQEIGIAVTDNGAEAFFNGLDGKIYFNILGSSTMEDFQRLLAGELSQREAEKLLRKILDTVSHEYRHVEEQSDSETMTHTRVFYRGQLRILEQIIPSLELADIIEQLRAEFPNLEFVDSQQAQLILANIA